MNTRLICVLFVAATTVELLAQPAPVAVPGAQGNWNITVTPNRPGGPDDINIQYTPNRNAAGCRHIRLSQSVTVRGRDAGGNVVAGGNSEVYPPPAANPFPHGSGDEVLVKDPDGSTHRENGVANKVKIDHLSCEGDPYYNGDDVPQDTASNGDATTGGSTTMSDHPSRGFGSIPARVVSVESDFENCAICQDSGVSLGCVHWRSVARRGAPGDAGQVTITPPAAEAPMTPGMREALKQFCRRHIAGRDAAGRVYWYCPDDGSLKPTAVPAGAAQTLSSVLVALDHVRFRDGELASIVQRHTFRPSSAAKANASVAEAMASLRQTPSRGLIAFVWIGAMEKSVPTIAFGTSETASEATLMAMPFASPAQQTVDYVPVGPAVFSQILTILREVPPAKSGSVQMIAVSQSDHGFRSASTTVSDVTMGQIVARLDHLFQADPARAKIVRFMEGNFVRRASN